MMKMKAAAAAIAAVMCTSTVNAAELTEACQRAEETIFIYMIGSDMAEFAQADIYEMLESGFAGRDTNVILIAGGSDGWTMEPLKNDTVNIFRLTDNGLSGLTPKTEYNLFDTDDIYRLMFRYMARYRADKYSVFFWDHGGGYVGGFGKDERGDNESISPEKLAKVFYDIKRDIKRDYCIDYNYDTVGFDACYMADIQTADAFAKAGFDYYIASSDTESACGWNYGFLGDEAVGEGGRTLCDAVISSTEDFNRKNGAASYTLSCIDLGKTSRVIDALNSTAEDINSCVKREDYLAVRYNTRAFGNAQPDSRFDIGSRDYADIKSYAENISRMGVDAKELEAAVDAAVIRNASTDESCGLTVYSYYNSSKGSFLKWYNKTGDELAEYKKLQKNAEQEISGAAVKKADTSGYGKISVENNTYSYRMKPEEAANVCGAVFTVYSLGDDGILRSAARVYDTEITGGEISSEYNGSCTYLVSGNNRLPCTLDIKDGRRSVKLFKDEGSNAYAADFMSYTAMLDDAGGIKELRPADTSELAAKTYGRINDGDRLYAQCQEYTEDNYQVHSAPDIVTAHNAKIETAMGVGEYYGRFELINPYGYVQYISPAIKIGEKASAAEKLHDKKRVIINGSEFQINGAAMNVPCSVSELEAAGYTLIDKSITLAGGERKMTSMRGANGYIDVTVKNFISDSACISDCMVTGISSSDIEYNGLTAGTHLDSSAADEKYETAGRIKYIYRLNEYSEIPDFTNGTLAMNGMYNTFPHDYVLVDTDRLTGEVIGISVNSEEGCEYKSCAPSDAEYEYSVPKSIGYDTYSFVMDIEGGLYSLPMPVSVMENNGWKVSAEETSVASMGSSSAVLERNGKLFTAELVNYSPYTSCISECMVCGIYIDYRTNAAEITLAGGINLKDASQSVKNGRYDDVSNKANMFMRRGGSMIYASGSVLDYDGEIEISADSAYIYRRYNGIRSMSGFDRLAKYFVY